MFIETARWRPEVRNRLMALIKAGAGHNHAAVFDFDNSIVCRNMGDPVAELLASRGFAHAVQIPELLSKYHRPIDSVSPLPAVQSLNAYYESYLEAARGTADQDARYADAYAWAVWSLAGVSPWEVVKISAEVYDNGSGSADCSTAVTSVVPGTIYPRPFCYPQIIDLMADLLQHGFQIWIVSSSMPWTVRWVILNVINPTLLKRGIAGLNPAQVFGIATLLQTPRGAVHADYELARRDADYAHLVPDALRPLKLTDKLSYPVPCFAGKAQLICEHIKADPYLVVGDSANDLEMFKIAAHCLWIDPIERRDPRLPVFAASDQRPDRWLRQPTASLSPSGFLEQLPYEAARNTAVAN